MTDFGDEEREDFARQDGVHLRRQRRSPPRLPAGTMGTMRIRGGAGGCMRLTNGAFLTECEKGLLRLIVGEVMNPIRYGAEANLPVGDDHRVALRRVARALFSCDPDDAPWLVPFLVELEAGRGERFAMETPNSDPGYTNLYPLAEEVVQRTRRSLQRLAPSVELPRWLTPRLTALFLKRFSFSGGGGPYGALTRESISACLADPRELANYLRESPDLARFLAEELVLLDATGAAPREIEEAAKPAQPDLIDAEHVSPSVRRAARDLAKASRPDQMARLANSRLVCCERGFLGVRFEPWVCP